MLLLRPLGQPAIVLARVTTFTPGGALRSIQAVGDRMATGLGIPYTREFSDKEAQVVAESKRSVRFVVIALAVLFVGLGGLFVLSHLGPSY